MTTTLSREDVALLTDRIEAAQNSAQPIAKLTDDFPAMTVADGYAVQLELRRRWLAQGRRQVGWKAGLTSKAKMEQMGVFAPGGIHLSSIFGGQACRPARVRSSRLQEKMRYRSEMKSPR